MVRSPVGWVHLPQQPVHSRQPQLSRRSLANSRSVRRHRQWRAAHAAGCRATHPHADYRGSGPGARWRAARPHPLYGQRAQRAQRLSPDIDPGHRPSWHDDRSRWAKRGADLAADRLSARLGSARLGRRSIHRDHGRCLATPARRAGAAAGSSGSHQRRATGCSRCASDGASTDRRATQPDSILAANAHPAIAAHRNLHRSDAGPHYSYTTAYCHAAAAGHGHAARVRWHRRRRHRKALRVKRPTRRRHGGGLGKPAGSA
jgi:hypothetical protein